MIQTIIFDLGNVIIPFQFSRGYEQLENYCGIPAQDIPARIGSTGLVKLLETGQIEPEKFVAELSAYLNLGLTYPEFCKIWSSIFLPEILIPESFFAALKKRYKLLLLSNTNAIHYEAIQESYSVLQYFDLVVLSHEVKAMKPDPAIYQKALELAECSAEHCLFIDDLPENIEGARRTGMDGIVFQSYVDLKEQLSRRGIRWE